MTMHTGPNGIMAHNVLTSVMGNFITHPRYFKKIVGAFWYLFCILISNSTPVQNADWAIAQLLARRNKLRARQPNHERGSIQWIFKSYSNAKIKWHFDIFGEGCDWWLSMHYSHICLCLSWRRTLGAMCQCQEKIDSKQNFVYVKLRCRMSHEIRIFVSWQPDPFVNSE